MASPTTLAVVLVDPAAGGTMSPVLRSTLVVPAVPKVVSRAPVASKREMAMSVSRAASPSAAGSCSVVPATTTLPEDCTTTPRDVSTALPPTAVLTVATPSSEKVASSVPSALRRATAMALSPAVAT